MSSNQPAVTEREFPARVLAVLDALGEPGFSGVSDEEVQAGFVNLLLGAKRTRAQALA